MWRGELRAVISPLCPHVVDSVKWWYAWELLLLTRFWNLDIALRCLQTPREPVKNFKGNEKVTWLVKKVSCLDFNRKLPSQWTRCAAFVRESEVKLLLPATAVVFKIRYKPETSSTVVHKKYVRWFRDVTSEDSWLHCGSEDYFSYFVVEWSSISVELRSLLGTLSIPA